MLLFIFFGFFSQMLDNDEYDKIKRFFIDPSAIYALLKDQGIIASKTQTERERDRNGLFICNFFSVLPIVSLHINSNW